MQSRDTRVGVPWVKASHWLQAMQAMQGGAESKRNGGVVTRQAGNRNDANTARASCKGKKRAGRATRDK